MAIVLYVYHLTGVSLNTYKEVEFENYFNAIITVESNWHSRALSPTGDIGLAQINPRGALREYNRYHTNKIQVGQLYDPSINIMVGKWYLTHMLKTFKGDFSKAVAAYNMGPNKIRSGMVNVKYVKKVNRAKKLNDIREFKFAPK